MKRFLEYLEDVKRQKRLLREGLTRNEYRYQVETIDLSDGRATKELDEAEYLDWNENAVEKDRIFGMRSLFGRITYGQVKGMLKGFHGFTPEDSDRVSFSVVGFKSAPPPPVIGNLRFDDGGSALISVYRYGLFQYAVVAAVSFNEAVSFFLASGCDRINPIMLYRLLQCQRPLPEDEASQTARTFADAMDYSREGVLQFVRNPKSHFASNVLRKQKYQQQIIDAKGDVGNVLVLNGASSSASRQYDNLLTDQNWMVAQDPKTGRIEDLMKCTVRTVVMAYSNSHIPSDSPDWKTFHKAIPRQRIYLAAFDETHGNVV